ncbi:MAG: GNAT family N-acetyltransferase [Candidatus Dormibacteraeota bacterium]|nr:GNAT family N-acetyltransferase [Candidatus Dormibacteraeota bacterium]
MNRTPIEVRPALRQDVAAASTLMARAFLDDPPFSWVLPAAETRERRLGRFFSVAMKADAFGRRPLADVEVATMQGRPVAAAIWYPPGTWPPTLGHQLATLPGNIWAFGRRLGAASALARALGSAHPRRPHWYLAYIGVEPALQGHGVASALLRHRLAHCDGDHADAYLESTKSSSVALYEHFGFEPTGVAPVPAGAPIITPMWRSARSSPL